MYRQCSQRRLEKGDRVLLLHDESNMGVGVVEWIGVMHRVCRYAGDDGPTSDRTLSERVLCARVMFDGMMVPIELTHLISESQSMDYDALEPGDLVVFGKKKRTQGVVVSSVPRKRSKNAITAVSKSVMVLQGGTKRRLHPCQDIVMIQRAQDYLHFK